MAERIYRFIALAALAFWMGGTTFYAIVVVPTGTRVLGATEQGFLTEQVTRRLNWIGVIGLVLLAPSMRASKLAAGSWFTLAATLAILFWLHSRVAIYLNHAERYVTDAAAFYAWHRAYLLVTAIQWLAGLMHLWSLSSVAHHHPRISPLETHRDP